MSDTMRAVIIRRSGGPEVLQIENWPKPVPKEGEVLIRIKAFGLNRSELFTRQGHSPNVSFPRVLGIEATGIVEYAPGGEFESGTQIATAMGGLGRTIDGGYAEYTCVPVSQAIAISTTLPWEIIGAVPEMLQTAWGSLFKSLQLQPKERLLIRGGTTSVGLAAAAIAKKHGAYVMATTRNPGNESILSEVGVDQVIIDTGSISKRVREVCPSGVNKVLELVGTTTLEDSLQCTKPKGVVCMTGMVGNSWTLNNFSPMGAIPTSVCLTTYAGDNGDFHSMPLQELLDQIQNGSLKVQVGKTFTLDNIAEAHTCMEENKAGGKIVVLN